MACGTLLRRNKVHLDHLKFPAHTISRAHNLGHAHILRRSCIGNIIYGHDNYKLEFSRTASQFVRFASTSTQPNLVLNHDKRDGEELADKKIVDKGYLDNDQDFEGSSSTEANRWRDSYYVASKVLSRVCSAISGIGPTLRAVVSMTSSDWVLTFEDWTDEFHHYRGIYLARYELMFLSAKITLRLLVKISGGKRLSKKERQILSQSTADLFSLVPVSMFNFVQFINYMLPVFLKLFPSMIPPTSHDKVIEQVAYLLSIMVDLLSSVLAESNEKEGEGPKGKK